MLHWLTFAWVATPRFEIAVGFGVILCGQILLWWRRDNILGYLAVATYIVTILIPLFGTKVVADLDPHAAQRFADIMLVGAALFAVGLYLGGTIGKRAELRTPLSFSEPDDDFTTQRVLRWGRRFAVAALAALAGAFLLLGYVPLLASDRIDAKYGIGPYAAGAARGGVAYHIALALGAVALPIILVLCWKRRTALDLVLCATLTVAMLMTLSRGDAFYGPLVVLAAVAVERRWKPRNILAIVCLLLMAGALANDLIGSSTPGSPHLSLADNVAAGASDVHDGIAFVSGFDILGNHFVGLGNLTAGLTLHKGTYDPSSYAVRMVTLDPDTSAIAAGGIRLPAPEWGYAAFAWPGVVIWSLISGLFAGWGTVVVRRLVAPAVGSPTGSIYYVLAWVFYTGTFGLLAGFYFPTRANLATLAVALTVGYAGWRVRSSRAHKAEDATLLTDPPRLV